MSEKRESAKRPQQPREWSIQQIAALAGTTNRTLRHYGDLGLLVPRRVAANGYRADERFGRTYDRHGAGAAVYVGEALRAYAATRAG